MTELNSTLNETLLSIVENEKLDNYNIRVDPLTTDGDNFSSSLYKVNITSSNREELKLFAKVASIAESVRKEVYSDEFFEAEKHFYTNIVPIYEKIQEKYGIEKKERLKLSKYYGSNMKYLEETIVLEDLGSQGYVLEDRRKAVDWEYASRVAEELAKFHALSFAYKHLYPQEFESYKSFDNMPKYYSKYNPTFKSVAAQTYPLIPEDLRERVQGFVERNMEDDMLEKYYGPGKWKVLVHGDFRTSNIMHKSENGKITEIVPIDFQIMHRGSPSTDLLYFLYNGTDHEFHEKYLQRFLDHYYEIFATWLRRMDMNPDVEFSRQDFDEDYLDMLAYGLRVSLSILPLALVEPGESPKLNEELSQALEFCVKPGEAFKERFLPILRDYASWNIV